MELEHGGYYRPCECCGVEFTAAAAGEPCPGSTAPDPASIDALVAQLLELKAQGVTHVLAHNSRGRVEEVTGFAESRSSYDDGKRLAVLLEARESPGRRGLW